MGRSARGVARLIRVLVLLCLAAALLGVGGPLVAGPAAPAADSRAAVPTVLPPGPDLVVPEAAERLHPTVPPGYAASAPAPPPPTVAPASTAPSSAPVRRHAPAATPRPAVPEPPAAPAAAALPLSVDAGSSTQVVTVVAPSAGSTRATLTAWQLGPAGWTAVLGPFSARIGRDGVGATSESLWRTPAGTFTLTEGFGLLGNPGLRMPYRVIDDDDYWVSDVHSSLYNQFAECSSACPFDPAAGEHLVDAGASYDYALVIDYNRWPAVPGRGSAFFLHVTNGQYTAGCVAIARSSLVALMRWLDPAAHPKIAIGVG